MPWLTKSPGSGLPLVSNAACSPPSVANEPRWTYSNGFVGAGFRFPFRRALPCALSSLARYSPCWFATCAVAGCEASRESASAIARRNSRRSKLPSPSSSNLESMSRSAPSAAPLVSVAICGYDFSSVLRMLTNSSLSTVPFLSTSARLNSSSAWSRSSPPAAALDLTSAQSPNAYALPLGAKPLIWRYLSTLRALRLGWPAADAMDVTSGVVPRPVDHTHTPKGIFSFFFVFLHVTDACDWATSVTRRFVRIRIPSLANFSSAYLLMRSSYVLRMWSADCTTVIEILSRSAG
mmetsp:Transcript_8653/g.39293  ORF Transcript_8653/g.39293 Transcript_8653/m.39293 type:complete len:293 (-) Transcript_8653:759-1637(-)